MISSRRTKLSAIAGVVLVFASVILFMRIFPVQESIHWTSLFFIVLGEALPIAGFIWLEDSAGKTMSPGLRSGTYSLFLVYGLAAVSLSLIMLLLGTSASMLATLQIVMALAFGSILLFAALIGGERGKAREKTLAAAAFMRGLEEEVSALVHEPVNKRYFAQLYRIEEAIKYSDYSGVTGVDEALEEKVRELKYVLREDDETETLSSPAREKQVNLLTEDLLKLVRSRNRELINKKKARNYSNG